MHRCGLIGRNGNGAFLSPERSADGPGLARRGYPQPPWDDIKTQVLEPGVDALLALGYPAHAVIGISRRSFLRVAEAVW